MSPDHLPAHLPATRPTSPDDTASTETSTKSSATQEPHRAPQSSSDRATAKPADSPGDQEPAVFPEISDSPETGGVPISDARGRFCRSGLQIFRSTESGIPLDPPNGEPAEDVEEPVRACAYSSCLVPLVGRSSRALYCSRAHKEAAHKLRQRSGDRASGPEIHWLCDSCGALYIGHPPTCQTCTNPKENER